MEGMELDLMLDLIIYVKNGNIKLFLHEKFQTIKYCKNSSIAEHISKLENIAKQLKDAGGFHSATVRATLQQIRQFY